MFIRTLILVSGVVASASAAFNATGYSKGILATISDEMTANGETNWSVYPERITLEHGNETMDLNFFRAYFTGLNNLTTFDECSIKNRSAIVDIQCLIAFPSLNFRAFGNRKGAQNPLVEVRAELYDALYVLRIVRNGTLQTPSFTSGSEPSVYLAYQRDPTATKWLKERDIKVISWIRYRFSQLVGEEVSSRLGRIVDGSPLP